jgi:hypothetical protein
MSALMAEIARKVHRGYDPLKKAKASVQSRADHFCDDLTIDWDDDDGAEGGCHGLQGAEPGCEK